METASAFLSMSQKKKAEAFDRIANEYFSRNFARLSKSDMDVLMFSILMNQAEKSNYTDYQIAQQLGITEARVRSFRVKAHLVYDDAEDGWWKKPFCHAIGNAKYDDSTQKVVMPIYDPNVKRELEAYIDSQQWYNEYQLNPKLLVMRPDQFILLYVTLLKEGNLEPDPDKMGRKLSAQLADNPASAYFDDSKFIDTWKNQGAGVALKSATKKWGLGMFKAVLQSLLAGVTGGTSVMTTVADQAMWINALSMFIEKL